MDLRRFSFLILFVCLLSVRPAWADALAFSQWMVGPAVGTDSLTLAISDHNEVAISFTDDLQGSLTYSAPGLFQTTTAPMHNQLITGLPKGARCIFRVVVVNPLLKAQSVRCASVALPLNLPALTTIPPTLGLRLPMDRCY